MHRQLAAAMVLLFLACPAATAQQPRLPANKLAADQVSVKRGPRLYGALLGKDEAGNLKLAVRREWLRKTHAKYYEKMVGFEAKGADSGRDELLERIDSWILRRPDDVGLQVFLKRERKRIAEHKEVEKPRDSQFMLLDILADEVRGVYVQSPERRQLLAAAWKHKLKSPEGRTPAALLRQLQQLKVDYRTQSVDFTEGVAAGPQSEAEWATRMAIVEYRLRKQVNFDGSGSFLTRTGAGAADIDLSKVLSEVLKDQLTKQLEELLGAKPKKDDRRWLADAIKMAEKERVTGFRIARLEKDVIRKRVAVEIQFYGRASDGGWKLVWSAREQASATSVSGDLKQEIAAAPDVKRIVQLMRATGLPLADSQLQLALGFGAATKSAMQKAQLSFARFQETYTKRLDGPPIVAVGGPAIPREPRREP